MNAEKVELNKVIENKQDEIANQLREKQIIRDNLTNEIERLAADVDQWKIKYADLDNLRRAENQDSNSKYDVLNAQ